MFRQGLGMLMVGVGLLLAGCQNGEAQALPVRTVTLTQGDKALTLQAEMATTEAARAKGLMFRQRLPEGTGMLFVWPEAGVRKFWMRNTLIPLDMVFFKQGQWVGTVAYAKPHDETPVGPGAPVDMVLEVPAGYAARQGIGDGWRLRVVE